MFPLTWQYRTAPDSTMPCTPITIFQPSVVRLSSIWHEFPIRPATCWAALLPTERTLPSRSIRPASTDKHSHSHSHSRAHIHMESRVLSIQISPSGYAKITFGSALSRVCATLVFIAAPCELISVEMKEQSGASSDFHMQFVGLSNVSKCF